MLRVRTVWTGVAGTPWYTNLFFAGTGSTDAQAAVDSWREFLVGFSFQFYRLVGADVDPFVASVDVATGDVVGGFTVNPGATIFGQETSNPLPFQTQALSTLRTPLYVGGRNLRGRVFLPGYTEASNDANGMLDVTRAQDIDDQWDILLASGPDLLVWSKTNGVSAPVASTQTSTTWSVLRSRRD